MSLEKARELFDEAARQLGFAEGASLDDDGSCTIVSETRGMPKIHVYYDGTGDTIDLFSEIGVVPDGRDELYREFLADNFLGGETRGATFALSRETGRLVLQRTFTVGPLADGEAMAMIIADFAEVAYTARQRICGVFGSRPDGDALSGDDAGIRV